MGIPLMEELVSTVGAILKTLECPICLELLKTPVSAGCGHFFCRHCVSGVLQSNYRAPCPLCKRSFTRRSVQAAAQRQTVISAARNLAQTCSSLMGINFTTLDNVAKEGRKSFDNKTPVPLKKFKASNEKREYAPSRKRKSIENEDDGKAFEKCASSTEKKEGLESLPDDDESAKKHACRNSKNEESDGDLPSLEELFSVCKQLPKSSAVPVINERVAENPLLIFPTDKMLKLKTYSGIHKKKENSLTLNSTTNVQNISEVTEDYNDYFLSNNKSDVSATDKESPKMTHGTVEIKKKKNALKNKTNEVQSNKHILDDDCASKVTHVKCSNEKIELTNKSKENEIVSNSSVPSSVKSPSKLRQSFSRKLKRSKKKSQTLLKNSLRSKNVALNQELATENVKDCSTLNEVSLCSSQCQNQNEQKAENPVEDPFKSMGLTDTAFSVNSVKSPLAAKTLSILKSPGWSRVKEVKKDFKVKKFTSLHVEKNSPTVSLKAAATSDQELDCGRDKSGFSIDITEDRIESKVDSAWENVPQDMDTLHSPSVENKIDQESGKGISLIDDMQVCQNGNIPELISIADNGQTDSYIEMRKETDYSLTSINNSSGAVYTKTLRAKDGASEPKIAATKLPAVNIISNSMICGNYTDSHDKISKQNIVKSKIICKIPNNNSYNAEVITPKSGNIISKYIQETCPEDNNMFFNKPSDIKQSVFSLPSQISSYQSFHAQSVVNENENFQYVEQSQQTSQMFNFDFQNSAYNNLNSIVEPSVCPNRTTEVKTKVLKRTCLTLEEIQDCFLKSSHSNHSETLCSIPFLDGLKLHIGVSDDTLNVSILKVIDSTSETSNAQSVLLNKYNQTSDSLFPLHSVLPSSNAESESSQPDSAVNPFPYLNKISGNDISNQDLPHPLEKSLQQNETSYEEKVTTLMTSETNCPIPESSLNEKTVGQSHCDAGVNENDTDISEIIHFPPEPIHEKKELFQEYLTTVEPVHQSETYEMITKSPLKEDTMVIDIQSPLKANGSAKCNIPAKHLNEEQMIIQLDSDEFSHSDKEEPLKKFEKCVQESKQRGKKISRLSLKKKSTVKRARILDSSDESDVENSASVKKSVSKVVSLSDKASNSVSPAEGMDPSWDLVNKENLKNSVHHSVNGETLSTLNSVLSEDATENNASEIVLEIEDLADKIKYLEEKLKQCGHSDHPQQECSKSKMTDMGSESEDSFDLFPQSVPPTPPSRV